MRLSFFWFKNDSSDDPFILWIHVCFPQEARMLSREREMKEELRRERDKEIELAIWTLEEETSKDKEECERAADNRWVSELSPALKKSCSPLWINWFDLQLINIQ